MKAYQNPRVTVISAFHQRRAVVERTLLSINQQTYPGFRAIIWDDSSSDGTWEEIIRVCDKLSDSRFTIFQNAHNTGLTKGLNTAISMAETEFVAVVGSGDTCHPERLAAQVAALDADGNASFCATASQTIDEVSGHTFLDSSFDGAVIAESDLRTKVPFTHGSVMYRRQAIIYAGGYEATFKWCADWDLFLRLSRLGHGVYINEPLYTRYAMLDGVSFNPSKSMDQIQYKYLVRTLAENPGKRDAVLQLARESLSEAVAPHKDLIARDLWKRQVKLTFMGRFNEAAELRALIRAKYGERMIYNAWAVGARCLSALPIPPATLISSARRLASFLK